MPRALLRFGGGVELRRNDDLGETVEFGGRRISEQLVLVVKCSL